MFTQINIKRVNNVKCLTKAKCLTKSKLRTIITEQIREAAEGGQTDTKASKAGQSPLLARSDDRHPQPIRAIQDHVTALAVSCWLHVTCHVPRAAPRDL